MVLIFFLSSSSHFHSIFLFYFHFFSLLICCFGLFSFTVKSAYALENIIWRLPKKIPFLVRFFFVHLSTSPFSPFAFSGCFIVMEMVVFRLSLNPLVCCVLKNVCGWLIYMVESAILLRQRCIRASVGSRTLHSHDTGGLKNALEHTHTQRHTKKNTIRFIFNAFFVTPLRTLHHIFRSIWIHSPLHFPTM